MCCCSLPAKTETYKDLSAECWRWRHSENWCQRFSSWGIQMMITFNTFCFEIRIQTQNHRQLFLWNPVKPKWISMRLFILKTTEALCLRGQSRGCFYLNKWAWQTVTNGLWIWHHEALTIAPPNKLYSKVPKTATAIKCPTIWICLVCCVNVTRA